MKIMACAALAAVLQANGCNSMQPKSDPVKIERPPLYRFESVSNGSPGVAMDTVTGQYCRTWDWTYKAESMSGGLDTILTCLSIYKWTPAVKDTEAPAALIEPVPGK